MIVITTLVCCFHFSCCSWLFLLHSYSKFYEVLLIVILLLFRSFCIISLFIRSFVTCPLFSSIASCYHRYVWILSFLRIFRALYIFAIFHSLRTAVCSNLLLCYDYVSYFSGITDSLCSCTLFMICCFREWILPRYFGRYIYCFHPSLSYFKLDFTLSKVSIYMEIVET